MVWEGCYLQASKITSAALLLPSAANIHAEGGNKPFLASCDTARSITQPCVFLACIHLVSRQQFKKEITNFWLQCLQSSHIVSATAWTFSNFHRAKVSPSFQPARIPPLGVDWITLSRYFVLVDWEWSWTWCLIFRSLKNNITSILYYKCHSFPAPFIAEWLWPARAWSWVLSGTSFCREMGSCQQLGDSGDHHTFFLGN